MIQFCLDRLKADGAVGDAALSPKLIAEEPGEPGPVGFVLRGRWGSDPDRLALYLNHLCDFLAKADSSELPKKWVVH